ncbi:hypothetical protein SMICM304S_06088 [Streptomyces microflavus]
MRAYGAVPEKGAQLRVPRYRTGGGSAGNVARGAISVLRSSVPYVAGVDNREAATGGVDGESVENAKVRARTSRVQERAVTARDYQVIAREAAPSCAGSGACPPSRASPVRCGSWWCRTRSPTRAATSGSSS